MLFTDDEINVLHDLILYAIDHDIVIPKCTWNDDCISCNLYEKLYNEWIRRRDET